MTFFLVAKVLILKAINVHHFRWSRYSMNRHEDDESTGHSSQSSRHSSRLFKYDDITILIGKHIIFAKFKVGRCEISLQRRSLDNYTN